MEVKLGFVESMRIDMERKSLSEADVGKALGISQQAVRKWLNRGYPPMSRVEALRALLGADGSFAKLTHEDLFGGRSTRTPDPAKLPQWLMGSTPLPDKTMKGQATSDEVRAKAVAGRHEFKAQLPDALHHNLDARMAAWTDPQISSPLVRLNYASDTLLAELSYSIGPMRNQSWSAALLRLMLFRDVERQSARALFILVSDEKDRPFPRLVDFAAKQYGVELVRVESAALAALAAALIAEIEMDEPLETEDYE